MTLNDWKCEFDELITPEHIKVAWDGGHAYHIIDHPLCDIPDNFSPDEEGDCYDIMSMYMCDHGPNLYCRPNGGCGCWEHVDNSEKLEYAQLYAEQVKDMKYEVEPEVITLILVETAKLLIKS
jgi:hypothetical protein